MLKNLLTKSEFTKNVLTLISGTIAAQAIALLVAPVLTRLYTVDDFGILAIFVSLSGLVGIIATGRYEVAIVLPKEDKDAKSLFALSVVLAIGVGLLSGLIVASAGSQISAWYEQPNLEAYLYLIPLSVVGVGVMQALSYYATREKLFGNISLSKVGDSLSNALAKVGMGLSKIGAGGLILGNIAGVFVAILVLLVKIRNLGGAFKDKANILAQAKLYSDFLKINTIHAFSDVLQLALVIYFLTSYFGIAAVGFYAFATRIIRTPISLVAGSVTQVFYQETSEKYANGHPIRPMVVKMTRTLALGAAPLFGLLMLIGPELFAFVFGEDWRVAGDYASIMSPWMFASFVVVPISQIPVVVSKQLENFLISLFGHLLAIGAVVYGGLYGKSMLETMTILSVTQFIFLSLVAVWIIVISGNTKSTEGH